MTLHVRVLALAALLAAAPTAAFAQEPVEPGEGDPATPTYEPEPDPEPLAPAEPDVELAAEPEPEPEPEAPIYQRGGLSGLGLVVGAKVGAGFPQVASDFDTTYALELELGYTLPVLDRAIELFLTGQYAAPSAEDGSAGPDDRLPGDGTWSYDVTMRQAILTLGALYRIPVGSDVVAPYVGAGARMVMWKAEVSGASDDEPFGDYEEQATDFGGYGALGADFFVGPGALLVEVQFGYASVDDFVLRDTNTGTLNAVVGYRLFL